MLFITGYNYANWVHNINNTFPPFDYLHRFVAKKYNINGYAVGWQMHILQNSANDETAFDNFFQILKELNS